MQSERQHPRTAPFAGTSAVTWATCPTCWGQGRLWGPGLLRGRLAPQTCPTCLGVACVAVGAPGAG